MEKQQADLPAPFPIAAQHVRSVQQARNEQGLTQEDSDREATPPNSTQKLTQGSEEKQVGWIYGALKEDFINKSKKRGCSYTVAVAQWNLSTEKRSFLGKVSVPELKKRRFLSKSATHNPWA